MNDSYSASDFPTRYDPAGEGDLYKQWEDAGAFAPSGKGEPFTIVLPPPNVTGSLHVGHAVMVAIEDLMVRYHRMKGDRTLWIPGVDHAAIATQNVVEKKIRKERDQSRHQLGREAFLAEVASFVETTRDHILVQIRSLGASLDWSRLAYTLDAERSLAVRTMFTRMYEAGVLYRGNRIINWCPRCQSTLADDEVEYTEETTPFYTFRYGPVSIGTARPETKFLDKTIVVHPDDTRYQDLIGQTLTVEWIDGPVEATVIADSMVDPNFGTGAMTITPAHSFEDFELAARHNLPAPLIINEYGKLTKAAGDFEGQKARDARAGIVAKLQAKGLVEKIDEQYVHNLSVCYRCGTAIEPLPKLQWFIKVDEPFKDGKSLKDLALEVVRTPGNPKGQIEIIPDRYSKVYEHWLGNLRDWCVSRQIWFGHRVPAWYRGDPSRSGEAEAGETYVGIKAPEGDGWVQDEDTLDTWFSSGTWTFSTLGWPNALKDGQKTGDLALHHPTSVLETGWDILFFWVARMILMSQFALGEIPFKTVYLHGLVRDKDRKKMSKSSANGIDPLGIVTEYGADALRMALLFGTGVGNDMVIDEQKVRGMRNFSTKVWNVARFVITNLEVKSETSNVNGTNDSPFTIHDLPIGKTDADRLILKQLDETTRDVTKHIEAYRFHEAAQTVYDFIWNKFAAVYVEASKQQLGQPDPRLNDSVGQVSTSRTSDDASSAQDDKRELANNTRVILLHVLKTSLVLLHPFMPFVTEAIWQQLPNAAKPTKLLISAPWPTSPIHNS